ncbi:hypothetical protein JTB14_035139 [Gonioctena quinquepunctata]|nr:hypothetical protein JTB14_035139 [Gonioctena quinquepunctata]
MKNITLALKISSLVSVNASSIIGLFTMRLACLVLAAYAFALADQSPQGRPVFNSPGRFLSLPNAEKCANRPKQFSFRGHNYFYSGNVPEFADRKLDWLDGRNICRERCMDLVSLETEEENNLIFGLIKKKNIPYIWTSGRLCDFKGCDRPDLEPKNILGWFWSANREKIKPTNSTPPGWSYLPWSRTGHKKQPQPDNAEYDINKTTEPCLAILNNVYNDGIAWHDVACYHEKPVVCEDSDELLDYVSSTNRNIRL